ncbi:MAG: aminotransferase class I/II-fold pyridoxal phosphate-dependent enzyme, partial [Desulfatiglandales bacterium]
GVSAVEGLIRRVDSVWLGRPNNPTGKGISKGEIKYLSKRFPQKLFILDESFVQFTEDWFPETYISGDLPQNIIVIHSLTKFYSLAGIRMGAAIAHRYMVESLLRFKEPWTVNGVADKIAPFLAFEEEYESKTRRFVKNERIRLRGQIMSDPSWDVLESEANYFLLKWKGGKTLEEVMDLLYKNGIFVRDARNFVGLEENYIRVGLRSEEENDLLLSHLKALTGEAYVQPISISGLCA